MNYFKIVFIFALSLTLFSSCNQDKELLEDLEETVEIDEQDDLLESRGRNAWMYFNRGVNNNRIFKSSSADNVTWSSSTQVNNGGETREGCAAAMFRNQAFVFYRGQNTEQIFFSKSSNGDNWNVNQSIGPAELTDQTPSAVAFQGRLFVAYKQANNTTKGEKGSIVIVSTGDGQNWSEGIGVSPNSSSDPTPITEVAPALATNGRFLYLMVTFKNPLLDNFKDQILVYRSSDGSSWDFMGSMRERSKKGPSAVYFDGQIRVAFNGLNTKTVYVKGFTEFFGTLSLGPRITVLNAKSSEGPSITARPANLFNPGALLLIYKGNSSNRIYRAVSSNGTNFSGNNTVTGETSRRPGALYTGF